MLGYQRRWMRKLQGLWQPLASFRLSSSGGAGADLRWSRELLPSEESEGADGSGLDVHLETSVDQPWPLEPRARQAGDVEALGFARAAGSAQLPRPVLRQSAEVVIGPRAQAKYLNLTLPVSVVLGAAVSSEDSEEAMRDSAGSYSKGLGPVQVYARLTSPGIRELRGWAWAAEVADAWAGLFRTQVQRPWTRGGDSGHWSLEHIRTHGVFSLPRPLAAGAASVSSAVARLLDGFAPGAEAEPYAAVIPTTRLRAGSDGGGAALALQSSESALGGSGWEGTVEANRLGWGARLRLKGGSGQGAWGQPQYTVTGQAPWRKPLSLMHEFKWTLSDGQGAWVAVRPGEGEGKKPRVNMGLEIR